MKLTLARPDGVLVRRTLRVEYAPSRGTIDLSMAGVEVRAGEQLVLIIENDRGRPFRLHRLEVDVHDGETPLEAAAVPRRRREE